MTKEERILKGYKYIIDQICKSKVPYDAVELFEKNGLYDFEYNKWNREKLETLTCFELGAILQRLELGGK